MKTWALLLMVVVMIGPKTVIGAPVRIWCLGDSITKGNSTATIPRASYRKELFSRLNVAGLNYDFVGTRNNGDSSYPEWTDQDHDGWGSHTSGNILNGDYAGSIDEAFSGVASVVSAVNPDVVLLHIGTNDYNLPTTTSMSNISGIISAVRNYNPNVTFFVANMIPIGKAQFQAANNALASAITSEVEAFSNENSPVHLVDMREGYNMTWFTDLVHPDSRGEAFIAEQWSNAIITHVPEPATMTLVGLGAVALIRSRKK